MKFRSLSLMAVLVLLAVPTFAVTFELTPYVSRINPSSSGTFNADNPNAPFDIRVSGRTGYGLGANVWWGDAISTEFAGYEVRTPVRFSGVRAANNTGGTRLKMIPLTAILQWHLAPKGFIDPYVGAGAAYVLFDNLSDSDDLADLGVNNINFKDDVGLALNAGLGFGISKGIAVKIDGKYVPIKSAARAVFGNGPNSSTDVKINPMIWSAGLSFRF